MRNDLDKIAAAANLAYTIAKQSSGGEPNKTPKDIKREYFANSKKEVVPQFHKFSKPTALGEKGLNDIYGGHKDVNSSIMSAQAALLKANNVGTQSISGIGYPTNNDRGVDTNSAIQDAYAALHKATAATNGKVKEKKKKSKPKGFKM